MTPSWRSLIVYAVTAVRQQPTATGAKRPGWLLFFVVVRLFVLLFSAELSGVTHAALDVFASDGAHESDDCDEGEDGHECPPGCPSCHCWHAGTPTPPLAIMWALKVVVTQMAKSGFTPSAEVGPQGADADSVYRPPRTSSFSS